MQCAGNAIEGAAGIEWNVIGNSRNVHNGFFVFLFCLFVCCFSVCLFLSPKSASNLRKYFVSSYQILFSFITTVLGRLMTINFFNSIGVCVQMALVLDLPTKRYDRPIAKLHQRCVVWA